jgi:hypothetical protein
MELSKIMSISGKPGLYKHIAQSKTSIVVESIIDGKRTSAFPSEQISTLSDISIYTEKDDVKLEDVLKVIFEKEEGKKTIDFKSSDKDILKYFETILPDYDKERVYISDIKKVLKWYNLLIEHNLLEFKEEEESKEEHKEDTKVEVKDETKEETKEEIKKEPKVKKEPKSDVKPPKKDKTK